MEKYYTVKVSVKSRVSSENYTRGFMADNAKQAKAKAAAWYAATYLPKIKSVKILPAT